jgi:uncharacterized protein (AIM24 family)
MRLILITTTLAWPMPWAGSIRNILAGGRFIGGGVSSKFSGPGTTAVQPVCIRVNNWSAMFSQRSATARATTE